MRESISSVSLVDVLVIGGEIVFTPSEVKIYRGRRKISRRENKSYTHALAMKLGIMSRKKGPHWEYRRTSMVRG